MDNINNEKKEKLIQGLPVSEYRKLYYLMHRETLSAKYRESYHKKKEAMGLTVNVRRGRKNKLDMKAFKEKLEHQSTNQN
jgi:hypothetical protein